MPNNLVLKIFDDSGLLSIANCVRYKSFLSADWEYEGLVKHFQDSMQSKSIVVWECGDGGGPYLVEIRMTFSDEKGFRQIIAPLEVTTDGAHLVTYDSLTMAAQFDDQHLPGESERETRLPLNPGNYKIKVIQKFDPKSADSRPSDRPDFIIEIIEGTCEPLEDVAWRSA